MNCHGEREAEGSSLTPRVGQQTRASTSLSPRAHSSRGGNDPGEERAPHPHRRTHGEARGVRPRRCRPLRDGRRPRGEGLRGLLPGSSAGGGRGGGAEDPRRRGPAPPGDDGDYSSILGGGRRPLPARSSAGGTGGPCDGVLLLLPPSSVRTAEGLLAGWRDTSRRSWRRRSRTARSSSWTAARSGGDPSGTGRAGLASLIDHPDELSGGCAAPCGGTLGHDGWSARSWPKSTHIH